MRGRGGRGGWSANEIRVGGNGSRFVTVGIGIVLVLRNSGLVAVAGFVCVLVFVSGRRDRFGIGVDGILLRRSSVLRFSRGTRFGGCVGVVQCGALGDDIRPGLVIGFEEFLFGEGLGLEHELGEIAQGLGGFGFDEALSGSGKESRKRAAKVASGEDIRFEEEADLTTSFLGAEVFFVFDVVMETEAVVVGELRQSATLTGPSA